MERKLAVLLLLLGMVALASCGLREKHVQKLLNLIVPEGQLRKILQMVVHKAAKSQFGCPLYEGYCETHCQDVTSNEGECHGMKCKCKSK
ncbi:scorpine-like peptide Tco 41.46-2 [Centruroides vittatus]|uniref:scorpine-like peptide Tco 41.46-2 n=1 Tax=Centruroides vittatus TaxID=120091 RepID=UPI00350EB2DE